VFEDVSHPHEKEGNGTKLPFCMRGIPFLANNIEFSNTFLRSNAGRFLAKSRCFSDLRYLAACDPASLAETGWTCDCSQLLCEVSVPLSDSSVTENSRAERSTSRLLKPGRGFVLPHLGMTIAGILAAVASLVLLLALHHRHQQKATHSANSERPGATSFTWDVPAVREASADGTDRRVFPYSIIRGGIGSVRELRQAIAKDTVVAKHYVDFDLRKLRTEKIASAQLTFVSYRVGNQVFWTKRKLMLAKGEMVVTDGQHMARARCGNRIAVMPMRPVSHDEPTAQDFDTPNLQGSFPMPLIANNTLTPNSFANGESLLFPPQLSGFASVGGGPSSSPTPDVPVYPVVSAGGTSALPSAGVTPDPTAVPEPRMLVLLLVGLTALLLAVKAKRHKDAGVVN
jgi:hypothetical protein